MMNDYVAGLHDQEEPEQIDCSSGIVPAGSITRETDESKEEREMSIIRKRSRSFSIMQMKS